MAPYSRDHVDVHWQSPLSTLSTSRRRRYAVAISQGNAQAALAFQFLHEIVKVLKAYFGDFTEVLDAFSWDRARVLFWLTRVFLSLDLCNPAFGENANVLLMLFLEVCVRAYFEWIDFVHTGVDSQ